MSTVILYFCFIYCCCSIVKQQNFLLKNVSTLYYLLKGTETLTMPQGVFLQSFFQTLENNSSVENKSGGTLENNSSIENNSGGTLENNSSVENNSGGTLENEQLVLYA